MHWVFFRAVKWVMVKWVLNPIIDINNNIVDAVLPHQLPINRQHDDADRMGRGGNDSTAAAACRPRSRRQWWKWWKSLPKETSSAFWRGLLRRCLDAYGWLKQDY